MTCSIVSLTIMANYLPLSCEMHSDEENLHVSMKRAAILAVYQTDCIQELNEHDCSIASLTIMANYLPLSCEMASTIL